MRTYAVVGSLALLAAAFGVAYAASNLGYQDTPLIPGTKWHVHDGERPQPPVVAPRPFTPAPPPSDAIVLFDGKDLSKWQDGKGQPSGWKLVDGAMEVPPDKTPGGGDIVTKDTFGDMQLHLEFCLPTPPKGDSQGRGNSGVFIAGHFEIQVLDSYRNPTYADGGCASVYGQYPPLANACRKPGEWQSYNITWTAPRFKDGQLESPAYLTLLHNGAKVQDHVAVMGGTGHKTVPGKYSPNDVKGTIKLQDHGSPVRYRNIWVRELKAAGAP